MRLTADIAYGSIFIILMHLFIWLNINLIASIFFVVGIITYFKMILFTNRLSLSPKNGTIESSSPIYMLVLYMFTIIILFAGGYKIASNFGCYLTCDGKIIDGIFDFIYYSVVTATSLGFGDISPAPDAYLTKLLTIVEILFGPVFLIALISYKVAVLQPYDRNQPDLKSLEQQHF